MRGPRRVDLPARAALAWHTTSATVTRARDGRSTRHGLRFFRWGPAVSIMCRSERADRLLSLDLTGCVTGSVTGSQLSGARATRLKLQRDCGQKKEKKGEEEEEGRRKMRREGERVRGGKKKKERKGNASEPRAAAAAAPPARRLCVDGPRAARSARG